VQRQRLRLIIKAPHQVSGLTSFRICLKAPPTPLDWAFHRPARLAPCVTPSVQTLPRWGRNVYRLSIHALPADEEGPIRETKDLSVNRVQGAYAKTKVKATLLAFQAAKDGLCTVVLHPTGIVGPYDFRTSIVGKLIINALSGKLKWYVSGGYDFVDARDVAKATYLALERGKCGENYIVAGDYVSMKDFLEQCFKTAGKPFNLKEIPYGLALAVSPFMEWYEVSKGKEPQMSIYALKTLRSKSDIDSSKIREELGFEPMPMTQTVKDLTNWYLSRMKEAEIRR